DRRRVLQRRACRLRARLRAEQPAAGRPRRRAVPLHAPPAGAGGALAMAVAAGAPRVGDLLRGWRQRRKLSQLELSLESAVSSLHLGFIETGRSRPSREMVLHLAERLDIPLRERNALLLAAGYAPVYEERALDGQELAPVKAALERFLAAHEPFPAIVVDL